MCGCDSCKSEPPTESPPPPVCATCAHRPVRVWAGGIGVPDRYQRKDARLPSPGTGDQTFGQDGWDVCLEFANADDLSNQLGGAFKLPKFIDEKEGGFVESQITQLAIHAHGAAGAVDINNVPGGVPMLQAKTSPDVLNVGTLPQYAAKFDQILRVLAPDAKLFFMCCLTSYGPDGVAFVTEVSKRLAKKNVTVIAYTSMLYVNATQQKRPAALFESGLCCYPGCRETNDKGPNGPCVVALEGKEWNDLKAYPWASESSRRATVARGGKLIKTGEFPDSDECVPSSWDGKCHPPPP
jgi:hypothetical protein